MKTVLLALVPAVALGAFAASGDFLLGCNERDVSSYARDGFDAYVSRVDLSKTATCDDCESGFRLSDPVALEMIARQRRQLAHEVVEAERNGLALCLGTDEVKFPAAVWEVLRKEAPDPKHRGRVDFTSERFWRFYRIKYREVLKSLPPCVKYVMIRTGENYPTAVQGFNGQTVAIHGDRSAATDYARDMARLINETRSLVADEFGRTLIWRTWDLGNEGFHANTDVYDRVMSGVTNRTGLVLSIKFCQTDYWSYNDFNPCIARDPVRKLIEFQSCREYEGKGVYPNYVGVMHGEALRRLAGDPRVMGTWLWGDHAGGSGGPFSKTDVWQRMNLETTLALIRSPKSDPARVLENWCRGRFGEKAAHPVARALMRSHAAVEKMLYVGEFARNHRGWKPHLNITRDDSIGGGRSHEMETIYAEVRGSIAKVFAEKDEAVRMAEEMERAFRSQRTAIVAERGLQAYEESLTGFIYLRRLAEVFRGYVRGYFLYCAWRESRSDVARRTAVSALQDWQSAWQDYQREIPRLPASPTPYQSRTNLRTPDGGMEEVCLRALRDLKGER